MEFKSKQLKYRSFTEEDFPLFYSVFSNEQVMRYAWIDKIDSESKARALFEEFLSQSDTPSKNNSYSFAVYTLEEGHFAGFANIELHSHNSYGGCGEIGYFLLPPFWGKGYATELAQALIKFGFESLGLHKLCARCNANNLKSEAVMQKAGMLKEGHLRKVRFKNNNWDDEKHYGILLEDWMKKELHLIQTSVLNDQQKKDIMQLDELCRLHDQLQGKINLSNAINFNAEIRCFLLLYEGSKLVSFLSMFIPTAKEAEISAYTHPEHRKQGCFTMLLHAAVEEIKKYSVESILFVHEPASGDAKLVLDHLNAEYAYSEYLLQHQHSKPEQQETDLTLEQVDEREMEGLIALNMDIFGDTYEEASSMVGKSVASEDILCFVARLQGEMLGVCNVNLESEEASIFGLGVGSKYQGKGYGKAMVNLLLNKLFSMNISNITLEVSSENDRAYNLYRKSGFKINTQFDYYRFWFR